MSIGSLPGLVTGAAAVGTVWFLSCLPAGAGDWKGDLRGEVGYWGGDATFSIGGEARIPGHGSVDLPEKISELTFPFSALCAGLDGSVQWNRRIEVHGSAVVNLTDPSGKVTDSDWGLFSDDEHSLDVYSESDAQLTAVAANAGVRYWFLKTKAEDRYAWSIGIGPGFLYQRMDWTVRNMDQWYPSAPREEHDYEKGKVATYSAEVLMPYVDACAFLKLKRFTLRVEAGVGPSRVKDEDDHLLRGKKSTADMTGFGVRFATDARFDLNRHLFALVGVKVLSVRADGSSAAGYYDRSSEEAADYQREYGAYDWEVDEKFSLLSVNGGVSFGFAF